MGFLSNKSNDELLGYLNNDDGTGLSEAAKQELARRGALPEWSSPPSNVEANLDAAATPITPDEDIVSDSERMANERGRIIRAGLHPQQPADPGTPEQQANWEKFLASNPDAMQRYRPDEYEAQQAEVREKENAALLNNIKMKYGESEADAWLASRNAGRVYVPRTAAQISASENREATRLAAARGDDNARAELDAADARYTSAVSRPRWAREAGLSMDAEETTQMSDGDLRLAAAQKRAADKQARELQWRAQLMMNRGNYAGALALPGMDDAMRSAVLNQQNAALNANRAGGPITFGPTPLGVQAIGAQNAFQLLRSAEIGQGLNGAAGVAAQNVQFQQRQQAAAYADAQWNAKPYRGRTTAARDRLVKDIDNRFGAGMGAVAQGLEVNDDPAAQAKVPLGQDPADLGSDPGDLPTTTW